MPRDLSMFKKRDAEEKVQESPKRDLSMFNKSASVSPALAEVSDQDEPTRTEAALRGTAQGLTANFADEIAATPTSILDDFKKLMSNEEPKVRAQFDEFGRATNVDELNEQGSYKKHRDEYRVKDKAAEATHPVFYNTGQVGGSIATSFIPGVNVAKNASVMNAAGKGAIQGFTSGVGASEKEGFEEAAGDSLWDAIIGGSLGGFFQKLGLKGKNAQDFAEQRAVKSLDPILSQQERLANKDAVNTLGRNLLDEKVIKFGSSVEDMAPRLNESLIKKGERIGEIRNSVDDLIASGRDDLNVDMTKLVSNAKDDIAESFGSTTAKQSTAKRTLKEAQNLAGKKKVGVGPAHYARAKRNIADTQKLVQDLTDDIPWNVPREQWTPEQKALYTTRKRLVDQIDESVGKYSPEALEELKALKSQFGLFKDAEKILDKSTARHARNATFSLRDHLLPAAINSGEGFMGGVKAAALATGSKLARERGNAAIAITADKLGKTMEAVADPARRLMISMLASRAKSDPNAAEMLSAVVNSPDPDAAAQELSQDPALKEIFK